MKSIDNVLRDAQGLGKGSPIVRVSCEDSGMLHPEMVLGPGTTSQRQRAAKTTERIVRVFYVSANFYINIVSDPDTVSEWESWSLFPFFGATSYFDLFWDGTKLVFVFNSSGDIYYSYSDAYALSWSAAQVAVSGASATHDHIACFVDGDSNGGIIYAGYNDLHLRYYDSGADTWGDPVSAGIDFSNKNYLSVVWDGSNERLIVSVVIGDYVSWANLSLVLFSFASGSWDTLRVFAHTVGEDEINGRLLGLFNGYFWLFYNRIALVGEDGYDTACLLSASVDGEYYSDGYPSGIDEVIDSLEIIEDDSGTIWLCGEDFLYKHVPFTGWSDQVVADYHLERSLKGKGLDITVLNTSGLLSRPSEYSILTLERGLRISGTEYYVSAGRFSIVASSKEAQGNLLVIKAAGYANLLDWVSSSQYTYADLTIGELVTTVCALSGVFTVSFDSNALWDEVIDSFSVMPKMSGYSALASLARWAYFFFVELPDGALYFSVPLDDNSHTGTFIGERVSYWTVGRSVVGSIDRINFYGQFCWNVEAGSNVSANHIMVTSDVFSDKGNERAVTYGRKITRFVVDRSISGDVDTGAAADLGLLVADEEAYSAGLYSIVSFDFQPGDIVQIEDDGEAEGLGNLRIIQIDEFYGQRYDPRFHQRYLFRGAA